MTCTFIPWSVKTFVLLSYSLELTKRYKLRMVLICLEGTRVLEDVLPRRMIWYQWFIHFLKLFRFLYRISGFQNQNTYERNFNLIINDSSLFNCNMRISPYCIWSNAGNFVVKTWCVRFISTLNAFVRLWARARAIAILSWKDQDLC